MKSPAFITCEIPEGFYNDIQTQLIDIVDNFLQHKKEAPNLGKIKFRYSDGKTYLRDIDKLEGLNCTIEEEEGGKVAVKIGYKEFIVLMQRYDIKVVYTEVRLLLPGMEDLDL